MVPLPAWALTFALSSSFCWFATNLVSSGDSTSLASLKKQLSVSIPLTVLDEKLKAKDAAHVLSVADLQLAAKAFEERRLENVRLAEENKRLWEAEKQRQSKVETLRMNGENLKLKLKEAVDAHDETVKAAKARETEHEQLVGGLVSEAERVNEIILGKNVSYLFFC